MVKRTIKSFFFFILATSMAFAVSPVKLSVKLGAQTQNIPYRAETGMGWAVDGKLAYSLTDKFDLSLDVAYDHTVLDEDSVILEWDWAYWDERYIDWLLTGASQEEVDSISTVLEYWRPDSSYHGVFKPQQWMEEIRLTLSADYTIPFSEKLSMFGSIGGGLSIYTRRLKVVEDWMKVFTWEWDSIAVASGTLDQEDLDNYLIFMDLHNSDPATYQLDSTNAMVKITYDYFAQVTHFAPDKKGIKFYLTPSIGLRYSIAKDIDLECAYQGIFYLSVGDGVIKEQFPIRSKSMIWLGLTFKY
ncbi:MAG: hypothetical protein K9N05_06715 [Candidatus Marinimicrobia bacterium]|nr:hypothetical protein [Candidatus Neomarinimicrobiota bacterium]